MLDIEIEGERGDYEVIVNGEIASSSPMESSRPLFVVDNFVIKFDTGSSISQSTNEIELWARMDEADKRYFAPIVQSLHKDESPVGIGYVVQPYFERKEFSSTEERYSAYENGWNELREVVRKYGIGDLDMYGDNWMITEDGEPLIYDYGIQ